MTPRMPMSPISPCSCRSLFKISYVFFFFVHSVHIIRYYYVGGKVIIFWVAFVFVDIKIIIIF